MPYKNKKPNEKKLSGRPIKDISKKQFEEMCKIQCTEQEICNVLSVGVDKLLSWCMETYGDTFSNVYKKFSDGGKMSIRRNQLRLSQTNSSMAIWLGKQYLGQRDNMDVRLNDEEDDAITKAIKGAFNNEHESD